MIIVGAGMAGLLAGAMIRNQGLTIVEAAPRLPNNHSAVLRFRSHVVGDALDIEFKAVDMLKCVHPWRNTVADSLAYSMKCNGTATLRSIMSADSEVQRRYIAPPDLIARMASMVGSRNIEFGKGFDFTIVQNDTRTPIISTIPMSILMDLLGWQEKPEFKYVNGFNINATVENCDAYVSVYIPDPDESFNRVSLTGDRMTIEFSMPGASIEEIKKESEEETDLLIDDACGYLGIKTNQIKDHKVSIQKYSKILPIDDNVRKRFIMWASEKFNIYSLGRFATWRPGLLLDDVVNDVRVIRKIIKNGAYDHKKQM